MCDGVRGPGGRAGQRGPRRLQLLRLRRPAGQAQTHARTHTRTRTHTHTRTRTHTNARTHARTRTQRHACRGLAAKFKLSFDCFSRPYPFVVLARRARSRIQTFDCFSRPYPFVVLAREASQNPQPAWTGDGATRSGTSPERERERERQCSSRSQRGEHRERGERRAGVQPAWTGDGAHRSGTSAEREAMLLPLTERGAQ